MVYSLTGTAAGNTIFAHMTDESQQPASRCSPAGRSPSSGTVKITFVIADIQPMRANLVMNSPDKHSTHSSLTIGEGGETDLCQRSQAASGWIPNVTCHVNLCFGQQPGSDATA